MKVAFAVLALAASMAFSVSTQAAGANGAVATPDGRTTISAGAFAGPRTPLQSPLGLKTIYSNYATDGDAYNCCSGWTISAEGSIIGAQQWVAMPFTPSANYAVKTITVAVGYVTGTNGATVSLNSDAGGLPGAVLKKGAVTGLPVFGTCCTTVSIGAKGTPVLAGTQYWVVVKTDKKTADTWDAWNQSFIASGPFAFDNGTGWQLTSGPEGAYSVLGKKM